MTERNMLKEGFIFNTLDANGAVSGTQVVTIPQMDLLVDGDISSTALSTETGNLFSLDADMGARWKLNRLELHTAEPSSANFDMFISDDGVDFQQVTMTGSAPLYIGDIEQTVASGAPRFVRYEHRGSAIRAVQEWKALADDTLVNFGNDGLQITATVTDAPIGRPSDSVTTLTLRNDYTKAATGFIVIESEGTGSDNIEIALDAFGPWFGRNTLDSRMPDPSPFTLGAFGDGSTTLAPAVGYSTAPKWSIGLAGGWASSDFTVTNIVQGEFRAVGSLSTSPTIEAANSFAPDAGGVIVDSPDSPVRGDFFAFRSDLYNRVSVTLATPTIPASDLVESARLFWRTHEDTGFELDKSMLSTASGVNFTGQTQEFIFEVDQVVTWSGAIRSLRIQPFTTATGIGKSVTVQNVEVYQDDRKDRVVLTPVSTVSGTFAGTTGGTSDTASRTIINTENKVTEPCIITSVHVAARLVDAGDQGIALLRVKTPTNLPPNTDTGVAGDNFEVKYFVTIDESQLNINQSIACTMPVWWAAEPGDMLAFAYNADTGFTESFQNPFIGYNSNAVQDVTKSGIDGGALISVTKSLKLKAGNTTTQLAAELNALTNWTAINNRRYNISFRAISGGGYLSTGTFTTNVVDGGSDPALLSLDFDSRQTGGSSIDVFTAAAPAQTVEARASIRPPDTSTSLARVKGWDSPAAGPRSLPGTEATHLRRGFQFSEESPEVLGAFWLGAHPMGGRGIPGLRYNFRSPEFVSDWNIGFQNPVAETRQSTTSQDADTKIENIGRCLFHHEVNDETWILNIMVSGTVATDARPIWDVYDPNDGTFIRTQHMKGTINYSYTNNGVGATASEFWTFEPVAFIPNYTREEIYIISREDQFVIGAGGYHGVVMDLDGNYKTVFFRGDTVESEMVAAGLTTTEASDLLTSTMSMTFDGKYFYALSTKTPSVAGRRDRMAFFRLADADDTEPFALNFISEINLLSVAGHDIDISDDRAGPQSLAYNSTDSLTYYVQAILPRKLDTWSISITGLPPNEVISVVRGPVRKDSGTFIFAPEPFIQGGFSNSTATNLNSWDGAGANQDINSAGLDLAYSASRDSLWMLNNVRSDRSRDLVMDGELIDDFFFFRHRNHSLVMEIGPRSQPIIDLTAHPNNADPFWGAASGTLSYESIQDNSPLFPTGRFAQVRYTLNASDDGLITPVLLTSQINQGIKVGEIPPAGTKDIFIRTNIPDETTIGDQTANLKVFWQLEE